MSKKLYLVQRGEVWHYHRRVPTALVSVVGKTFFKKSLGVKDLKSALPLRNVYNIHVDAQLAAAEKILSGAKIKTDPITQDTAPVAQTSIEELTENVRQYVEGLDLRKSVHFLSKPPDHEDQRRAMKEDAEIGLQTLRNRDNPNGADWIKRTSQKFFDEQGASHVDNQIVSQIEELIRRALMEVQHRTIDRLDDRYDRRYHDALFDPNRAPSVTFGELVKIFWAERSEEYRQNEVSEKRADKVKAELDFLLEAVGEDAHLATINDDAVQKVKSILSRLPANRKKHYPNLNLDGAIKKGVIVKSGV